MSERADAHIHLFDGGYQGGSLATRDGVQIDEAALYQTFRSEYGITCALVVGYANEPWCHDNNQYVAAQAARHDWVKPTAFWSLKDSLAVEQLEELRSQKFVGLSMYIFSDDDAQALQQVDDAVWQWLIAHRWLISVNSKGAFWGAWQPVLEKHSELKLLVAHLGLPEKCALPPTPDVAAGNLQDVLNLARFPGAHVKLSGFYAMTDPGHDFPHRAAWPYVQALLEQFSADRLLWASDISPCLDWLSFPQTVDLFRQMPFLTESDREKIEGQNLLTLIDG